MCGIFGIINGKHFRSASGNLCNLVANGIMVNAVRGIDSTGIVQLDSKNVWYHKAPVSGANFIQMPETSGYINDADNSHFTLVHNRAATEGKVAEENCHPFDHVGTKNNYVIGVHNGTLRNWKNKDNANFEVDSDWALSRLAEEGVDALKKINGAYVFVWYDDADPGVLNFARNFERPMYVMFVKGQNRMIFASEFQMVTWLAARNNIDLESEIVELAPSHHYRFEIDNPKNFTKQYYTTTTVSEVHTGIMAPHSPMPESDKERLLRKVRLAMTKQLTPPPVPGTSTNGLTIVGPAQEVLPPRPYVSADEVRMAKSNGMFKESVNFIPEHYDETSQALWGSIVDVSGELACALIRRVVPSTYASWKGYSTLVTSVQGAMEHEIEGKNDLIYVLSRNVELYKEGEASMAEAIKRSIEAFNRDKEDERALAAATHH